MGVAGGAEPRCKPTPRMPGRFTRATAAARRGVQPQAEPPASRADQHEAEPEPEHEPEGPFERSGVLASAAARRKVVCRHVVGRAPGLGV